MRRQAEDLQNRILRMRMCPEKQSTFSFRDAYVHPAAIRFEKSLEVKVAPVKRCGVSVKPTALSIGGLSTESGLPSAILLH